ncbi:hypothetical protein [Mesorhizobium sp. M0047]|uniref:hypothetical protein n=1 Tax=Mesorhizobium sp. M0047 TaxID=2956859 RepID=UPI0033383DA2
MKCLLVQESWVPHEDARYERVGDVLLRRIMGAEVRLVDKGFDIGIRRSWEQPLDEAKSTGGRPYAIPAGPQFTNMAGLGTSGSRRRCAPRRNSSYIVVWTVTGSTHAGMIVGFAKDGRQRNARDSN